MSEDEPDEYMEERSAGLEDLEPKKEKKDRKTRKALSEKDKAEALEDAYRFMLSDRRGRLVFYDRLDNMGYWRIPYDPTSAHQTAYLAGNHAGAVELYEALWAISPDDVLTMIKENRP